MSLLVVLQASSFVMNDNRLTLDSYQPLEKMEFKLVPMLLGSGVTIADQLQKMLDSLPESKKQLTCDDYLFVPALSNNQSHTEVAEALRENNISCLVINGDG